MNRMRTHPRWMVACAMIGACTLPGTAAPGPAEWPGTYEVTVCTQSCDPAVGGTVLARGHLVLESSAYDPQSVPETARTYFERHSIYLLHSVARGAPNACFVLERSEAAANRTYAGIQPVALTRWTRSDSSGTMRVPLFRSPDAGYVAEVMIQGAALTGTGKSWGSESSDLEGTGDIISGRRIGPPDRDLCLRAAAARAN